MQYKIFCDTFLCSILLGFSFFYKCKFFFPPTSQWDISILRPKIFRNVHYSWTPKHQKRNSYILVSIRCAQAFRMHKGSISRICISFPRGTIADSSMQFKSRFSWNFLIFVSLKQTLKWKVWLKCGQMRAESVKEHPGQG